MANVESQSATEEETSDLKNKMDDILKNKAKKNKVKNNYSNIETFQSLHNNDDSENDREDRTDLDGEGKTEYDLNLEMEEYQKITNEIMTDAKESNRKRGERWKKTFKFLTDLKPKDMSVKFDGFRPVAKGWGKIFKAIFYMYPILVRLIVDDCVAATPITMEGDISTEKFKENKKHDGDIMINTAHEFGYVLVTLYFSHMIYARLYSGKAEYLLKRIETITDFSETLGVSNYLLHRIFFLYLTLLPTLVYYFLYHILKNCISFMGLDNYPSLKFVVIFIVCYGIANFFLDKLAKMFLQIFEWKASATTYVLIVISWFIHLLSLPYEAMKKTMQDSAGKAVGFDTGGLAGGVQVGGVDVGGMPPGMPAIPTEFDLMIQSSGLYIFVLLIHLAIALLFWAPLCQLIGVIYIGYALVGGPSDWLAVFKSFADKDAETCFKETGGICEKSLNYRDEMMGGFDNFSYLYAYRYLFIFVMLLFFSFKTIQSAIEMKVLALRTFITTINAYCTAFVSVCYFGRIYYEKTNGKFPPSTIDSTTQKPVQSQSKDLMSVLGTATTAFTAATTAANPGAAIPGVPAIPGLDPNLVTDLVANPGPVDAASLTALTSGLKNLI